MAQTSHSDGSRLFTNLQTFWDQLPGAPTKRVPPQCLMAFDPGETTGVAVFRGFRLVAWTQISTAIMSQAPIVLRDMILQYDPTRIVHESYRVYSWKTESHAWEALLTPRVVGAIETLAALAGIPCVSQTAQQGKGFCTDERLKEWGLYQKGLRHANDAIRHGAHHILFPSDPEINMKGRKA